MEKRRFPKLVNVLILTLVTVVAWVGFDIYRLFTKTPAPVVPLEISNPLNPTLDEDVINQIESRIFLDDSQIPDNVLNAAALEVETATTPIPTLISTPEANASKSAEVTEQQ